MATTVNRSIADCPQRVVDPMDEIAQLAATEEHYRRQVSSEDPDGTMACAFEAHRIRRIRMALTR